MQKFTYRQAIYAILILFALPFVTACEDFHENNGDFGGMWQLTEWRNAEGTTLATNDDGIYYSVHRSIIQYKHFVSGEEKDKNETDYSKRYFSLFKHTADSLIVYNFVNALDESKLVEMASMKEFGIPLDGRFHIDHLDAKKMILSYEGNTLCFRKY